MTVFRELTAERRVEGVALSHLSIELGHLYMDDFAAGPERLHAQFARVAPWARVARETGVAGQVRQPRISTCFLIDDYFTRFSSPAEVLPALLAAARANELDIDYLVRESSCAEADGVKLAELVAARLTALPPPDTNGSRPPVLESGWLCNGQRSPVAQKTAAMEPAGWGPPEEIGARNHSVFVDVELWRDQERGRLYSCAYLAAVWQLLRLGMVRNDGASVVRPKALTDGFPDSWDALPPITQLRSGAAPFCAFQTFSLLPNRFLQVEHAVRVILEQIAPQPEVLDQLADRGRREGITVSPEVTDRVEYLMFRDG